MMNEPISLIMKKELSTVTPNDTLATVRALLSEKKIHHVPVVEGDRLVGLISNSDLLKLNRNFDEYEKIFVSELMTKKLAFLEPDDKVGAAAEIFLLNRFHAVPVVNNREDRALVGLVTTFDILRYEFKKEYPNQDID
ncbi:MAG: CBS domain-containing protein [Saprospiraceae bacterium]|nr:CBS domain-containing protein [Saprospiraceae bacterium]